MKKFKHCKFLFALQKSDKITNELRVNFRVSPRKSSVDFGYLPNWSEIVGKWPKTSSYTKQNNIDLFVPVFIGFLEKIYCYVNFLLLVIKCLKFYCFMLQSQKIKCLVLSKYPHSDPPIALPLMLLRHWTVYSVVLIFSCPALILLCNWCVSLLLP